MAIVWAPERDSLWRIIRDRTRVNSPDILEAVKVAKGIKDNAAAQNYLQSLYSKNLVYYGGRTGIEWAKWMKVVDSFLDVLKREREWKEQSKVASGGRRGTILTGAQGIRDGATILGGMRKKLGE